MKQHEQQIPLARKSGEAIIFKPTRVTPLTPLTPKLVGWHEFGHKKVPDGLDCVLINAPARSSVSLIAPHALIKLLEIFFALGGVKIVNKFADCIDRSVTHWSYDPYHSPVMSSAVPHLPSAIGRTSPHGVYKGNLSATGHYQRECRL
jgi:hypothetical protein